ncbi:adenylate/guanylate cyclase domain-containing protein, partial [Blastococcus sp. CCUG 61487]|uniref:ATP-binding protein n=1 Tax=Blastococcus sp. CCUG 61487 TaxID=1840703 RepID=UPI0010C0256E
MVASPEGRYPAELRSLEEAITALEAQRALLGDGVVETALAPLVAQRDRLVASAVGEQRKQVTVLFADLVDSTPVARKLDPEDLQQVMSGYYAAARRAVEAEGGVVEKYIGDAVMAVFGLHRSREDDAARAVRAALAMRQALERLDGHTQATYGARLPVRIGIDTGEVVVTGMAGGDSGEFLAVGETINRAARLQGAAPPGSILLSADTAGQVRGAFGLRRLTGLELKGLDGPVDAYVVEGADREGFWPEGRGIEGVETETVGRAGELDRLRELFTDVVSRHGRRVVTVLGEAGIGKSRVLRDVEAWLARLPTDVWVLRGRAVPSTQGVANALLRSVFAERFRIRGTDDPTTVRGRWTTGWTELLGAPDGAPEEGEGAAETVATWLGFGLDEAGRAVVGTTDPQALRRRGSELVRRLLDRLARRAPVVVLLEDVHWADAASLDSLAALAGPGGEGTLLVVASARPELLERRPEWGAPAGMDLLPLRPLEEAESRDLVRQLLQRAREVPDELVGVVAETADGNPFFVEELVKWLVQERVVDTASEQWTVRAGAVDDLQVPTTLRGLLQARLDVLPPAERGVVGCAAVVGRVFWDQAVDRLASAVRVRPSDGVPLDRLAQHDVVVERPRSTFAGCQEFSFRHALLRDVAYEGVLRSARRLLHAEAAGWLEDVVLRSGRVDEHAAQVAGHHEAAGHRREAASWYLRAGRYAAGAFANDDALRLIGRAEALLADVEEPDLLVEVLLAREAVLDRLGRREEQRVVLDRLAALPAGPEQTARIRLAEARLLFFRGEYSAVPPVAEEAAGLAAKAGRQDLEADALMQWGRSLAYLAEHAAARRLLRRSLVEARAIGDHKRAGEDLRLLGVVATNLGENEEALRILADARAEHRSIDDHEGEAMVTGQVGALLMNMGRLEEARQATEEALAEFRADGHRYREGVMLTNLARIAMDQGRLDDALEGGRQALELTEQIDDAEGLVASLQSLGDSARLAGDLGAARAHLERGLAESRQHELPYFTAHLLASLAAVDLAEGLPEDALAHAARAQEEAATADVPHAGARADLVTGMVRQAAGDPAAV